MQFTRFVVRAPRLLKHTSLQGKVIGPGLPKNPLHSSLTCPHLMNRNYSENKNEAEITSNPFFDKYKDKIKHMQEVNPEEYEEKMKDLAKRLHPPAKNAKADATEKEVSSNPVKVTRPSQAASSGVGMTQAKSLDSILKMELVEDKTAEEITKIWTQYHSDKDCIFAVIKDHEYQNLVEKSKECPVFVLPIRRKDGFEMILAQFDRHDVYFTPLAMFQLVKEDSPPCLTLNHYAELMDSKGVVLMTGQYDDKVLTQTLALSLVQQLSIFYGKGSNFYHLVQKFNHKPEAFDYNELIAAFKTLPQYDME